ncbi:MAG: HAMP domain-containing sensor histidine kinase [Coleofasciculaceae cyanobacterium]
MTNEFLISELFATLDFAVMERMNDGSFTVISTLPPWFLQFYGEAASLAEGLKPDSYSTFLENFLTDAEEFWAGNHAQPLKSGPWCEADLSGIEYCLEATAVKLENRKILLLEQLGPVHQEKQRLIQKGRENSLNHQELIKEIQKKEILIHCIIHDLSSPLTIIFTSLELLERKGSVEKQRNLLEICKIQCNRQEKLIREMLEIFSTEIESLENFHQIPALAPNALHCLQEVRDAFLPTFLMKHIKLQLEPNIELTKDWKVVGEKTRLERIIINLIENALRYSPEHSTVKIGLQEKHDKIVISVDDEGAGVSPELNKDLFKKFSKGKINSGKAGLGLYFCRLTVERWGGTIGYLPRNQGGSRFWFCLPKPEPE